MPPQSSNIMAIKTKSNQQKLFVDGKKISTSTRLERPLCQPTKWNPITTAKLRIAIVVVGGKRDSYKDRSTCRDNDDCNYSNDSRSDHVLALSNPASSCCPVAVTFLNHSKDDGNVKEWCQAHGIDGITHVDSFEMLLNDPFVEGVYFTGSGDEEFNAKIIEKALYADKHVLVDDPVTTSVADHCRLINLAHSRRIHLQSTTMFVYHYAIREFLSCVLDQDKFGVIRKINTSFDINSKITARANGIRSQEDGGCINDLCRYCAALALLIVCKSKRRPLSAQVVNVRLDANGNPSHCICQVQFEGDVLFTADCSYVNYIGTRQSVDVHSESHSASMGDFAFCSHSLACYRLYQKSNTSNNKISGVDDQQHVVLLGESIDVDGGPKQEVSMWRKFAECSTNAFREDEMDSIDLLGRFDFSYAAIHSQSIASALNKSLQEGCSKVFLPNLDLTIP